MKNMIIANNGSIQSINGIPDDIKAIYKTVWEISQKKVLDLAADRGAFICQSQSLNVHLQSPSVAQLTSMHFYGWKKGLKTGMYYLRTRPAAQAIQFTLDHALVKEVREQKAAAAAAPAPAPAPVVTATVSAPSPEPAPKALQPRTIVKTTTVNSGMATPPPETPVTPSTTSSKSSTPVPAPAADDEFAGFSDEQRAAAARDPDYAEALRRQMEQEAARLQCSIDNKEACVMCSG